MLHRTHVTGPADRAVRGQRLVSLSQMTFGQTILLWTVEEWRSLRAVVDGAPANILDQISRDNQLHLANVPFRMKLRVAGSAAAMVPANASTSTLYRAC